MLPIIKEENTRQDIIIEENGDNIIPIMNNDEDDPPRNRLCSCTSTNCFATCHRCYQWVCETCVQYYSVGFVIDYQLPV
jgi:hypothetical protein